MHQRANSKAESAVKIMKSLLVKTHKDGGDPYEALLEQRNTPRQDRSESFRNSVYLSGRRVAFYLVCVTSQRTRV